MRLTVLEVTVAGNRMEAIRSDTQQDSEPPTKVKCSAATLAGLQWQKLLEISKYLLFCYWDLLINI